MLAVKKLVLYCGSGTVCLAAGSHSAEAFKTSQQHGGLSQIWKWGWTQLKMKMMGSGGEEQQMAGHAAQKHPVQGHSIASAEAGMQAVAQTEKLMELD